MAVPIPLAMMLTLADSRLPVGGHVHSAGVEQAVADRLVTDVASLRSHLEHRVRTGGLVAASIAAAVAEGRIDEADAQGETDARTPSAAARAASVTQGRGMLRLARRRWPHHDFTAHVGRTHLPVISGTVGRLCGLDARQTALVSLYTAMTGSATAGQRLLALDPADVAMITMDLAGVCEETADLAALELADLSDPVFDVLAERHERRDMPLFAS
ncbi:urease accessory protein UreF [Williamsia sp. Leaf354]|uniref:urease accessory protein UreF n=1 Tax=Williamsia sp. Leaf354 TaxID=1736349 RepID=UPI0006F73D68|nr:urease accessory UreF family protein [Williamsia sp. Leaf354]KQR98477.1 urease accessory protein UreF [Williamsia sp. Leaf354]